MFPPGQLRVCALLGTPPGKLKHINENLTFIADFIVSYHLLRKLCRPTRHQIWSTQLDLYSTFEKLRDKIPMPNLFLSGPSPSEHFGIPIEEESLGSFPGWYREMPGGKVLRLDFLHHIKMYAKSTSSEDQILVILFGRRDGTRVECGATGKGDPVWLELAQVDRMLKKATARVKVITGACFSAAWHRLGLDSCAGDLVTALGRCDLLPDPSEFQVQLSDPSVLDDDEGEDEFFYIENDSSVEDELASTEEEEEEQVAALDEAEMAELDAYAALWDQKMRALMEVVTVAYYPMRSCVRAHQTRSLDNKRSAALLRVFRTRGAADDLAQELAEEAGIVHPGVHCRDFPEGDEPPPCMGLEWEKGVRWGEALLPRDEREIDRFERRYRRAGHWLFHTWSQSGAPVSVLNEMLEQVGGGVD